MKPWTDLPFLCLDTETTGVDIWSDRIVEIAAVTVMPDGQAVDPLCLIVDPGIDIPDEAAAIHGITTERARTEGVQPAEALTAVAERVFDAAHQRWPIVAFNARFDWPLCIAEAERHDVEWPALTAVLDPYLIDRMADKYRKGKRQLTLVADHYGVELADTDAHGALADATAAGRVMRQILARYPAIGEHTLADVFVRQVRGHEAQRVSFIDYKRRTDPTFDDPPGWPVPASGPA